MKTTGLLTIERIVLESLEIGPKSIHQIAEDTGLGLQVVKNIVGNFLLQDILDYEGSIYYLNRRNLALRLDEYNLPTNVKDELKDLFFNFFNNHFINKCNSNQSIFKLKKIFLTEKEEKILKSYFYNIEVLLKGIQQERRIVPGKKLYEQKVVTWSMSNYVSFL